VGTLPCISRPLLLIRHFYDTILHIQIVMAINNNNNKNGSRLGRGLPPGMDPSSYWVGGWVGPRAGLDTEARGTILCLYRGSKPGRTV
jgi:hypothetical protein